jgi:hypothetical protein
MMSVAASALTNMETAFAHVKRGSPWGMCSSRSYGISAGKSTDESTGLCRPSAKILQRVAFPAIQSGSSAS